MPTDEISQYLEALERENDYRVDCVLKQSASETTQRVFYRLPNGSERGPYIRKYIERDSGMGNVYQRIFESNRNGAHFAHIPHVMEFYRSDQATVVVMEHVNGPTLADVVYERAPGVALAAELFPALCDAVSELHESFDPPVIHRDLKPSNIIVRNGIPVIIDFGIAREFRAADTEEADRTDTTHLGTQAYAPPEQFGYEQTTVRSDVYALGMLLYFLLVEQTPNHKVLRKGFQDARIPEDLRQVIVHATAFDPKDRYASAAELKEAFLGKFAKVATPEEAIATSVAAEDNQKLFQEMPWQAPAPIPQSPINLEIHLEMPPTAGTQGPTPAPSSPTMGKPSDKGRVRNIVVLVFLILFLLSSWRLGFFPSLASTVYPLPYHYFMYFIFMPIFLALVAYCLLDKDWLKRRIPSVRWPEGGGTGVLFLVILVPLLVLVYIVGTATGAL